MNEEENGLELSGFEIFQGYFRNWMWILTAQLEYRFQIHHLRHFYQSQLYTVNYYKPSRINVHDKI